MAIELPELTVVDSADWRAWLAEHHDAVAGVWLVPSRRPIHRRPTPTTVAFTAVSASSATVVGIGRAARKLRFYPATVTGTCAAAAAEPTTGVTTFGSATLTATGRNRLTLTVALRGVTPDTTYAVYVDQSGACSASPQSITTNARGNGTGRARVALVSGATQLWVTATSATAAFATPAVTLMAEGRSSFWRAPRGRGFRAH
jgi:hypothetical protein